MIKQEIIDNMLIEEIIPYKDNPFKHKKNIKHIKQSLEDFGYIKISVSIDEENVLLTGHGTIAAMKSLGWTKVPKVLKVSGLTDKQKKAYRIADNTTGLGIELDFPLLDIELPKINMDMTIYGLDYTPKGDDKNDDDVPEPPKKAKSKTGDLYILGEHRLLCGDATKKEDVEKLMNVKKADMVFTDPPYGINLNTDYSGMVGISKGNKYKKAEGDSVDYNPKHIFDMFGYCKEIFLWGGDYYAERIPKRNEGSFFVWDKTEGGIRTNSSYDKMFGSNFELCWSKQKHKRQVIRAIWKGFFGLAKEDTKNRIHPTQKPLTVCEWFIKEFSKTDNIIVDVFGGSGSTLIACEKLSRKCRMMEIDPLYIDVIVERYVKFTGNNKITKNGKEIIWKE